jgi:hypothetical protein
VHWWLLIHSGRITMSHPERQSQNTKCTSSLSELCAEIASRLYRWKEDNICQSITYSKGHPETSFHPSVLSSICPLVWSSIHPVMVCFRVAFAITIKKSQVRHWTTLGYICCLWFIPMVSCTLLSHRSQAVQTSRFSTARVSMDTCEMLYIKRFWKCSL